MILKSISPSKLQQYSDCPRCFFLMITGKRPEVSGAMRFGSRLHKAIEYYHKKGQVEFDDDLQKYLDVYMEEYTEDFDLCEQFWKVPLLDTDMTLNLKLDLIKDNILTDHKTSKRPYTQKQVDEQKQVTAYFYGWQQQYSELPDEIRFNVFNTDPKPEEPLMEILRTHRSKEDVGEWEFWVRDILQGIYDEYFEPRPAPWHNYPECPRYVERE